MDFESCSYFIGSQLPELTRRVFYEITQQCAGMRDLCRPTYMANWNEGKKNSSQIKEIAGLLFYNRVCARLGSSCIQLISVTKISHDSHAVTVFCHAQSQSQAADSQTSHQSFRIDNRVAKQNAIWKWPQISPPAYRAGVGVILTRAISKWMSKWFLKEKQQKIQPFQIQRMFCLLKS